jgi:hypothetical protein
MGKKQPTRSVQRKRLNRNKTKTRKKTAQKEKKGGKRRKEKRNTPTVEDPARTFDSDVYGNTHRSHKEIRYAFPMA